MNYPTPEEVEQADWRTILLWYRNLPSPGTHAMGSTEYTERFVEESVIMRRICELSHINKRQRKEDKEEK